MQIKQQLIEEIEQTPDEILSEVLDFLLFIKSKKLQREKLEITLMSESVLAKDWLTAEEDEAWKDL
jgi:hypothetical protein